MSASNRNYVGPGGPNPFLNDDSMAYISIHTKIARLEPFDSAKHYTPEQLELYATKLLLDARQEAQGELSDRQRAILSTLNTKGVASASEVAEAIGSDRIGAHLSLKVLEEKGLARIAFTEETVTGGTPRNMWGSLIEVSDESTADWLDDDQLDKRHRREVYFERGGFSEAARSGGMFHRAYRQPRSKGDYED